MYYARFCLAWSLFFFGVVHADEAHTVATHYTASDGLPVDSTYASIIDEEGFLWIATHDGLARFDGVQFSVFDMARSPRMPDNRIVNLYRDVGGHVYALTANHELLSLRGGRVKLVVADGNVPLSAVRFVQSSPLCVTQSTGIYCADDTGRFSHRDSFEGDPGVAAGLVSKQGVWIIVPGGGIWLQLGTGKRRSILRDEKHQLASGSDTLAQVDRKGALWLAVGKKRLLHAEPDGAVRWLDAADGQPLDIVQLRLDPDGSAWVGTYRGVFRAVGDRLVKVDVPQAAASEHLMQSWRGLDGQLWSSDEGTVYRGGVKILQASGSVGTLYFDEYGGVWVTTLRDGLYALTKPRVDVIGTRSGLIEDNLYGVDRAPDGSIWTGSLGGRIQVIQPDGSIRFYGAESGLPGANTWAVAVAQNGDAYAATYAPGLYRKVAGSGHFERVALPSPLGSARVLAIDFDPVGRIWIGSTQGAWRRDPDGWHKVWPTLGMAEIDCILHAADGSTWLGGSKGLSRLAGKDTSDIAPGVFGHAYVRGLFQDREGAIWASTQGQGLIRVIIDGSGHDSAMRLGRQQGLPSNSPHAVRQDSMGNLWVNSNQGIFRIGQQDLADFIQGRHMALSPLVLGEADGLSAAEGNGGVQPDSAIDAAGRLLFPTQHGLVRIDPQQLTLHTAPPRPIVDGLEDSDRAISAPVYGNLPQGLRSVQIRYGAVDLHAGDRVRFRYRLQPTQERWTDAGSQRVASFVALAPGQYRFEVLAGNSDGFWSRLPATVQFYVPPRWYEATHNRVLLGLSLLLLLAWLHRQRTRAFKAHAADLDAQVAARTMELAQEKDKAETALADLAQTHRQLALQAERLEAMDAFRIRLLADVSHELRTPLMLVQLVLKEMAGDSGAKPLQQQRIVQSVQQAERLNTLVEQLIGLAQAEAGQIRLCFARVDLPAFVRAIAVSLQPVAARAGTRLVVNCESHDMHVFIDRDRVTTVLGNLIDNACRYAPPGSSVEIGIAEDIADGCARVTVSDLGPGFPPEVAEHLFQRFFRLDDAPHAGREGLGIGLALARELVDLHGGHIGAIATPGKGAQFWFELPLGSAHVALEDLALEQEPGATVAIGLPSMPVVESSPRHEEGDLLMVEDHPDLASYLGERLAEFVHVRCVGTAGEAWKQLERRRPALIIIDVVLPDGSGIALCRQICRDPRFEGLPVVLMSARATQNDQRDGLQAGAMTFLAKPFSFDELLTAIVRGWPTMGSIIEHCRLTNGDAELAPMLELAQKSLQHASFGIAEWADQAHLSERQLRRRVIDLTGMAPQAWLREQRLQLVHRLVQDEACRTLAEAGARAGIENASYLYRLYRERFGQASQNKRDVVSGVVPPCT
jgi:signal transduction histidine kinase/ligand-binding sensor domain-containing protein/CheY-like chemotaxis protein